MKPGNACGDLGDEDVVPDLVQLLEDEIPGANCWNKCARENWRCLS
ncbi:MAG: hypothetical protein Ct9H300mP27_07960 [Chloroflexota bacterium]|nr:MAG: hypothetical protein Ct9H300mP27_07960 [Chloroflexota bacterium]